MAFTNDTSSITALLARLDKLRPDSQRLWGTMSVDQMLWHVNEALAIALGDSPPGVTKEAGLARRLMKHAVLRGPWPKGRTPTGPTLVASGRYDFESERRRLKELVERLASKKPGGVWPPHPTFGAMSGRQWIHLQMRHVGHHLSQFGV